MPPIYATRELLLHELLLHELLLVAVIGYAATMGTLPSFDHPLRRELTNLIKP